MNQQFVVARHFCSLICVRVVELNSQ